MSKLGITNSDPLTASSRSLVRPSNTSRQQGPTRNQQVQQPVALSEQACKAKEDLEVLVATGKTEDFLRKKLTSNELDNMSERELLKYHKIYKTNLSSKVNDALSKIAISGYTKLVSWFFPIKDTDKLYCDLRGDFILMNEIDSWTGWLSFKMGHLMAVASTSLITISNVEFSNKINGD